MQTEVRPTQALEWPQQIEWCEHATIGDPFLVGEHNGFVLGVNCIDALMIIQ